MPIITFKHEGKVYQRRVERKQGFYVMESKGVEYWFGKDVHNTRIGWQIVNGKTLPEEFMKMVVLELEKLFQANPSNKISD
jgi:hypothetical protein